MLRKFVVLGVLAVLLMPAFAMAQPAAQDWELTLSGSGTGNRELNAAQVGGTASLGYYLTQNLEVGVRQSLSYIDADHDFNGDATGGSTLWNGSTRGAVDFNFDLDKFVPFLGGTLGYIYGDGVKDTWVAGLEGGIKYFVHKNAFIFAQVEYQFDLRGKFVDGQFVYGLGIGVLW